MDLEIINKLYLELSQVATAKTDHELRMEHVIDDLRKQVENLSQQTG